MQTLRLDAVPAVVVATERGLFAERLDGRDDRRADDDERNDSRAGARHVLGEHDVLGAERGAQLVRDPLRQLARIARADRARTLAGGEDEGREREQIDERPENLLRRRCGAET